jgi:hypothetical protein
MLDRKTTMFVIVSNLGYDMKFNILFFLVLLVLYSCFDPKAEKDKYDQILSQEECNLVIESPPKDNSVWFEVKGYDPISLRKKFVKLIIDGGIYLPMRWIMVIQS